MMSKRTGFAVLDLVAVVAVIGVGGVLFAHATAPVRRKAMGVSSMQNLSVIGQMAAAYRRENQGLVSMYSWKVGVEYQVIGEPFSRSYSDDTDAHRAQNKDILRRLTGRYEVGSGIEIKNSSRIIDRRYSHLVLADDWGFPANTALWASPGDRNLRQWQADPLDVAAMPYGSGDPVPPGYDQDANWQKSGNVQRWAYSSSYQWVTASWSRDTGSTWGPVASTPHLYGTAGFGDIAMGGRRMREVMSPSSKVHVFEEFEWTPTFDIGSGTWTSDGLWGTYDGARSAKLMFDGSVHDRPAGEANSSWNPGNPDLEVWRQRYVPLDTFPTPIEDPDDEIDQRFRWTRNGLGGIDYLPGVDVTPGPLNRSYKDEFDENGEP